MFELFPEEFFKYTYLKSINMSGNKLTRLESHSLTNLTKLEILDLSYNSFSKWEYINPNNLLLPATNLKKIFLSYNSFTNFSNLNHTEYLASDSLELLDLSGCEIMIISRISPLSRLTKIKTLILNYNPINWMMPLTSPTLEHLHVSHCALRRVSSEILNYLPFLTHLHMSHNFRLAFKRGVSLSSTSLKYLDISFCNMNEINIEGLLNVDSVILRGNMLRTLPSGIFYNNTKLEYLDLSSNAIAEINEHAFHGLISLKQLNLSVNVIPSLRGDIFLQNPNLTEVILSRNQISSLSELQSNSIIYLDISVCEIQYIESNTLSKLPSLLELNLSRNFLSYIPSLKSNSLQILDISFNRISSIDNITFKFLPKLTTLHLFENRFTTVWKVSYFDGNPKLTEISLHDNMWRCDCYDEEMKAFFRFLTNDSPKIYDLNLLKCHSPSNVSGDSWMNACVYAWYPTIITQNSRPLNFLVALLCAFFLTFIVLFMVKRTMRHKHVAELEERQRRTIEARERLREIQMRREQEEERNAPDPRDLISPPSYSEALLMPKLDGSFHSLSNLDIAQKRQRKRMRRRTRSSGDLLEDNETLEERRKIRQQKSTPENRRRQRSQSTNEMNDENVEEIALEDNHRHEPSTHMHESDL